MVTPRNKGEEKCNPPPLPQSFLLPSPGSNCLAGERREGPSRSHRMSQKLHLNLLGRVSLQIHRLMPPSTSWGEKLSKPGRNGNPRPCIVLPRTQNARQQSALRQPAKKLAKGWLAFGGDIKVPPEQLWKLLGDQNNSSLLLTCLVWLYAPSPSSQLC